MPGEGHAPDDGEDAPEEAFALLGNEIRAAILRELGDAQGQQGPPPTLSFSELHRRVDADIDTSQFNYHLQQLVGRFVDRTDDGYRMRHEGTLLYRTIRAGTFTREGSLGPVDAGLDCHFCDGRVEAGYEDATLEVRCPDCGHVYNRLMAPPSAVADADTLLERVAAYNRHLLAAFARGVCPICVHGLDTALYRGEELALSNADRRDVLVHRSCPHCGQQMYLSVGEAMLFDPGVVAFCREHGVDVTAAPVWELPFAATDRSVTVRSTEPWRVALELAYGDDRLELVVDDELDVVERSRR